MTAADREGQGGQGGRHLDGRRPQQPAQRAQAGHGLGRGRAKAEGELKVAVAQINEAKEQKAVAKAELNLAKQILKEHTIVAPFDGVVIKRMKNPGESVRANEAVVEIGKLSRLCANAYVPLEHAFKVREGQVVEIRPRVDSLEGGKEEIESKMFRGKITFVDPQIQAVAETARRIRAEFDNPDFGLMPGLKVQMTIYLTNDVAAQIPQRRHAPDARARTTAERSAGSAAGDRGHHRRCLDDAGRADVPATRRVSPR